MTVYSAETMTAAIAADDDHLTPDQRKVLKTLGMKPAHMAKAVELPPYDFERGDDVEVGLHLAASLGPKGDVAAVENRIWQYNGATWTRFEDDSLAQTVQGYAGKFIRVCRELKNDTVRPLCLSNNGVKGIIAQGKVALFEPQFFAESPFGAPFATTFARIDGAQVVLERLTRKHRVKSEHAVTFDPPRTAKRPETVDALLAATWAGCEDVEQRIAYFWEWLGAAICGIATRYKDTPLLVGPKDAGKSQILEVIAACFPVASRRSVPLHAMSSDYHRAHLSGGRINFVNELPARELLDGEAAKSILSGETVSCRRPCENVFDWVDPRCAHVFACNELPSSRDAALMGRFVLLNCPNIVAREDQDRHLGAKIRAEAPLICAAALAALPALLARGYLIRPGSAQQLAEDWNMQSDPVLAWARETIEDTYPEDVFVPSGELYESFTEWAAKNGHSRLSSTRFGMRLGAMGFHHVRRAGTKWHIAFLTQPQREAQQRWHGDSNRYGSD